MAPQPPVEPVAENGEKKRKKIAPARLQHTCFSLYIESAEAAPWGEEEVGGGGGAEGEVEEDRGRGRGAEDGLLRQRRLQDALHDNGGQLYLMPNEDEQQQGEEEEEEEEDGEAAAAVLPPGRLNLHGLGVDPHDGGEGAGRVFLGGGGGFAGGEKEEEEEDQRFHMMQPSVGKLMQVGARISHFGH